MLLSTSAAPRREVSVMLLSTSAAPRREGSAGPPPTSATMRLSPLGRGRHRLRARNEEADTELASGKAAACYRAHWRHAREEEVFVEQGGRQ